MVRFMRVDDFGRLNKRVETQVFEFMRPSCLSAEELWNRSVQFVVSLGYYVISESSETKETTTRRALLGKGYRVVLLYQYGVLPPHLINHI